MLLWRAVALLLFLDAPADSARPYLRFIEPRDQSWVPCRGFDVTWEIVLPKGHKGAVISLLVLGEVTQSESSELKNTQHIATALPSTFQLTGYVLEGATQRRHFRTMITVHTSVIAVLPIPVSLRPDRPVHAALRLRMEFETAHCAFLPPRGKTKHLACVRAVTAASEHENIAIGPYDSAVSGCKVLERLYGLPIKHRLQLDSMLWSHVPRGIAPAAIRPRNKKYIVFGTHEHDPYAAYLPALVHAWSMLGFKPVVVSVGEPRGHVFDVLRHISRSEDYELILVDDLDVSPAFTSEMARLFAAAEPTLDDDAYLLVGDLRHAPLSDTFLLAQDWEKPMHVFGASFQPRFWSSYHKGQTTNDHLDTVVKRAFTSGDAPLFSVPFTGATVRVWREVMAYEVSGAANAMQKFYKMPKIERAKELSIHPLDFAINHAFAPALFLSEMASRWPGFPDQVQFIHRDVHEDRMPFTEWLLGQAAIDNRTETTIDAELPYPPSTVAVWDAITSKLASSLRMPADELIANVSRRTDLSTPCTTYLEEPTMKRLLDGYAKCHEWLLEGNGRVPGEEPRFVVYRTMRTLIHGGLGWGNNEMFIISVWMFAIMTGRAFLIDFDNTFGFDLREYVADPPFNWSYQAAKRRNSVLQSNEPVEVRSCVNLINNIIPVLQVDYMICEENYFLWDDPLFDKMLFRALKDRHPYFVHGALSKYLIKPSAKIARLVDGLWASELKGHRVIGLQLRTGELAYDWQPVLQGQDKYDKFWACANAIRFKEGKNKFFLITDDNRMQPIAKELFGDEVFFFEGKIEHFCDQGKTARMQLFVEWFMFAKVEDAVVTSRSSFGYSSYSRTQRMPVSIDPHEKTDDPKFTHCTRQTWGQSNKY